MLMEYTLKGLNCANCAAKIESAVQKSDGIMSASVNFMTATLSVDISPDYRGEVMRRIEKIVHEYEPGVVISAKNSVKDEKSIDDGVDRGKLTAMLIGAVVFAAGFLLNIFYLGADKYLTLALFVISYVILGADVLLSAIKNIARGQVFDENFLMGVATVGAFAIGEYPEAAAVMLFYQIGEYFQGLAVRRSKKSIADLMDIRPDFANLKVGDDIIKVAPDTVEIGSVIVVKPGEKIPLDGVVIEGESMVDTTALTGESVPRRASVSDAVLSGCINRSGVLTVEVSKMFGESTAAKIIDLVESASGKKASAENFITTFAKYYTPVVVGLAALIAVIPPLFTGADWMLWLNRGLIFLVISCPCALVVSVPLGFFGGIGSASRRGILVKGSNYLEALNNLDIVVFDKTGTLTKGVFEVTKIYPSEEYKEDELLEIAANAESFSNHPIALSVIKAYGGGIDRGQVQDYHEIPGQGISANVKGRRVLAGNGRMMEAAGITFSELTDAGTKIYIAVDNGFAGCIVISDEIKPDSRRAVSELRARGVRRIVMLTGDNAQIAESIAGELNVDEVYAGLLPNQKVEKLEAIEKEKKGKLAFVGDGINDAPVLARADIGIAMGGLGSDAAIEAADVVLMTDEPLKLAEALDVAGVTKRIVLQNIVFALVVKGIFMLAGAFGIATLWEAVFADVGVALLAVLNSARVMRVK